MSPSKSISFSRLDNAQNAIARRFLNVTNWDGALERMSRYELSLGRQLRQTLFVLDVLGRRGALRQHHTRSCWSNIFPLGSRAYRTPWSVTLSPGFVANSAPWPAVALVDGIERLVPSSDGGDDFVGVCGPCEGAACPMY